MLRHVARAFPRFVYGALSTDSVAVRWRKLWYEIYYNETNKMVDNSNLNPGTALRFWLGGVRDANGHIIGFSRDPLHPFDNTTTSRIGPFFEFDPSRLPTSSTDGRYFPPGISMSSGQPYVYFRAELGNPSPNEYYTGTSGSYVLKSLTSIPNARPYWDSRTSGWVNNTSYQILCCGLDGIFGQENVYPTGVTPSGLTSSTVPSNTDVSGISVPPANFNHLDDQTNFTSGTIGDDLP